MPHSHAPEPADRNHLADAQEAMDSYWAWEEQLARIDRGELDGSDRAVQKLEDEQAALLDRAFASAATSIAESLARIATALDGNRIPPPTRPPTTDRARDAQRHSRGRRGRRGQAQ